MNIKCHGAFKGRKCPLLFATGDLPAINLGKKDGTKCMRGKFGRNIKFIFFFLKRGPFLHSLVWNSYLLYRKQNVIPDDHRLRINDKIRTRREILKSESHSLLSKNLA